MQKSPGTKSKHLDSLAIDGLQRHPGYTIYLEKTFRKETSPNEVNASIRQINNYLNKVKRLPRNRFFIRSFRGKTVRTNGYLVPPDVPVWIPRTYTLAFNNH